MEKVLAHAPAKAITRDESNLKTHSFLVTWSDEASHLFVEALLFGEFTACRSPVCDSLL